MTHGILVYQVRARRLAFQKSFQLPIYAALPEAPKMPPLPETGIYPPEVIKDFTEEQFHEAMNPIPFFPNNYRFMVAHQRLKGASIAMVFTKLVI